MTFSQPEAHQNPSIRRKIINHRINFYLRGVFCVFVTLACCAPTLAFTSPKIEVDMDIATAGYYRLNWSEEVNSGEVFVLQEATNSKFDNPKTIYKGPDLATVNSGKSNGKYYYRVRTAEPEGAAVGKWSEVVSIEVKHHGLSKAVGFFVAGLIVFLATLIMIVKGANKADD